LAAKGLPTARREGAAGRELVTEFKKPESDFLYGYYKQLKRINRSDCLQGIFLKLCWCKMSVLLKIE
jgi:hypothetical protein